MNLKYFDAIEGVWLDISGQPGASLEYDAETSGWVTSGGYKKYVIQISQSGTNDPVVIVLENTLGFEPNWTRYDAGIYGFDWDGDFNSDKCAAYFTTLKENKQIYLRYNEEYNISLKTSETDDQLVDNTFELRYYN